MDGDMGETVLAYSSPMDDGEMCETGSKMGWFVT